MKNFLAFIFVLILSAANAFAKSPMSEIYPESATMDQESLSTAKLKVQTYEDLLRAIRETRAASDDRIEKAVNAEKVREAWETGNLILRHFMQNKFRADYGERILKRLAQDLGSGERELRYMVEFAKEYPILQAPAKLTWSHYQTLLAVNDAEKRREMEDRAVKENWSTRQLREEVRRLKIPGMTEILAEVKPGRPHNYRIVKAAHGRYRGQLVVDLGFSIYYKPDQPLDLKEGDLVTLSQAGKTFTLTQDPALKQEDLYHYEAEAIDVVDGDTFYAMIDLGFGMTMKQRIRLLRVDAAEILTTEGKEAKDYLEKLLGFSGKSKSHPVELTVKEIDQHGRPLAIVFAKGKIVDSEMVDAGLASVI